MNVDTPDFWQERYIDDNIPWDTKTTTPALIDSIDHSTRKKNCYFRVRLQQRFNIFVE